MQNRTNLCVVKCFQASVWILTSAVCGIRRISNGSKVISSPKVTNNLKDPLLLIFFALCDNTQSISHKTRRLSSKSRKECGYTERFGCLEKSPSTFTYVK